MEEEEISMRFVDYIIDPCEIITIELVKKIEDARNSCQNFGVGILSDELFFEKEHRRPIRPYLERAMIKSHFKGVDFVFEVRSEEDFVIHKEEFYYNNPKTKQYHIGYAPGTYDLLHQGHIEHLTEAFSQCDILIVGINSDELVQSYKNKLPIMNTRERAEIVSNLKFVDAVFLASTLERWQANEWVKRKYGSPIDAVFIGSDWEKLNLHNDENLNIVFTYRDPNKMAKRSSTYYRDQIKKISKN